jgi:hypothetical protein
MSQTQRVYVSESKMIKFFQSLGIQKYSTRKEGSYTLNHSLANDDHILAILPQDELVRRP